MLSEKEKNKSTIIHIGYPKTGTSWFQSELFPLVDSIQFYRHHDLPGWIFNDLSEIEMNTASQFFDDTDKRIIISDEKFVGNVNNMYDNPAKYKRLFPNAEVIIFIRNQIDKFASNYSHHILMGGTCSISDFLFPKHMTSLFNGQKHKYDGLISSYKSVFGEDHVHTFLFEEFRDDPKGFVKRFGEIFNLSFDPEKIKFNKLVNRRLSLLGFRILRKLNLFTRNLPPYHRKSKIRKDYIFHIPYWNELTSRIIYSMNHMGLLGRKYNTEKLLGGKNIQFLTEYFAESNRNLIQIHGLKKIKEYNYPL